MSPHPVVLFDGVCNLCDASINFLIDRDPKKKLRFAALQSKSGQELLQHFQLPADNFDTVVLVMNDKYYTKSSAALRIAKILGGIWALSYIFILIPPFIRDFAYNTISRNRYKWFGMKEFCRLPTPDVKERFLD